MTEILFYHLQGMSLESVLPPLLEKSLERGWKVIVQGGLEERIEALDALLWTYRDDGFLPHGTWRDPEAAAQLLQRFVDNTPWAHLDIAGTAMGAPKTEINHSWGSGFGVRLLDRLVADHYEK